MYRRKEGSKERVRRKEEKGWNGGEALQREGRMEGRKRRKEGRQERRNVLEGRKGKDGMEGRN
jgi:hypothetical protein